MTSPAVEDVARRAARSLRRERLVDWSTEQHELLPHELILFLTASTSPETRSSKPIKDFSCPLMNLTIYAPPFEADVKKGALFHPQKSSINES